jgi:branched-subunit amino acid transport protein AzlD
MTTFEIILVVISMSAATFLTRLSAFLFPRSWSESEVAIRAGNILPNVILSLLVVYSIKFVNFKSTNDYLPNIVSILTVIILQYWKGNILISVSSGTFFYMLASQSQFFK